MTVNQLRVGRALLCAFVFGACGGKLASTGDVVDGIEWSDAGKLVEGGGLETGELVDAADIARPRSCRWPAELDVSDAFPPETCKALRRYLSCIGADGTTVTCTANDPSDSCPNARPGVVYTCTSQCGEDEYGANCPPPPPSGPRVGHPPDGCRRIPTPSVIESYCCPCGS